MVSKKDKDAENGLQVIAILGIVWTIGILYWSRNGDIVGIELNQLALFCCNSANVLLTLIFLASWRYTARENRVKDYLDEHFTSHDSVSLKQLIDQFKISHAAAYKAQGVWIIESKIKGVYDPKTGIFARDLVEPVPSEIIDIESDEVPDEPPSFCPECGEKLTMDADNKEPWCENCKKHI
ncbi:MAG: hypothetical protein KAJ64_02875 [Thermoplasmata archaeon]|nr:hypothetical protein [Thermoplasmata archaeon]